ncbi:MAG: DUF6326 family protein [Anaerolineales bacterium]
MDTNTKTIRILEDVKINVRIKLSALWISLMLLYIYADILGFYTPGNIESVVAGEIGGIQITEGFLFMMAMWMAIPSVMVFLSLTLKANLNRWVFLSLTLKANLNRWVHVLVGIISLVALGATFFVGEFSARYTFQAILESVLIALIVWYAWKWPKQEV